MLGMITFYPDIKLVHMASALTSGGLFALRREQRWRFWRRPLPRLDAGRPDHVPA